MVGTEAWNDTRLIILGSPILAVIGVFLGRSFGVHLASSELGDSLILGLFSGMTVLIGLIILAAIDKR